MIFPKPIWAIIPTRGGSKGLPEKNILQLAGKPMLHYMVEAALNAKSITKVFLTTDCDKIANVASVFKKLTVLKHNPKFSRSGRPTFGVFQDTLKKLITCEKVSPAAIALLRVTTPLCVSNDIDNCFKLLFSNPHKATAVLSVVKSDVHPKRTYVIDHRGVLKSRENTHESDFPHPRQTFDEVYIRNGAIYVTFPEVVLKGSLWGEKPISYIMPKERSVNINDEIDFILAEELLKER